MAKRGTAGRGKSKSTKGEAAPPGEEAKAPRARGRGGRAFSTGYTAGAAKGRHLVIVESPAKAKTINKYLGNDYLVMASVGHVRDLPSSEKEASALAKAEGKTIAKRVKGDGVPAGVPGVDIEHGFRPSYMVLPGKEKVISDLKRAAKESISTGRDVWFATDLDREGEAIAWHLAQELGITSDRAKRVMFAAITKSELDRAFGSPHAIDEDRVNAQQARRILDRIVGYQVSPLLWKKVARGLSAGRVQSVAVRLVVEREREIRSFVPEEYWSMHGAFVLGKDKAGALVEPWRSFLATRDAKGEAPSQKARVAWVSERSAIRAELVEVAGQPVNIRQSEPGDLTKRVEEIARLAGAAGVTSTDRADPEGKGPAGVRRAIEVRIDPSVRYTVASVQTKRTSARPPGPFITSTLQQAASTRLGFGAQRTMRAAQQLYEGVEIPGEGPVGLITYMRTDSTHLSREALEAVRGFIGRSYGDGYLPEKPNFFSSSNKDAQEAHEAIRPTSMMHPPSRVKNALKPDQLRLYQLIWDRFVACQMCAAQWDATTVTLKGGTDPARPVTFRASGRVLVFDGFYKVAGVPSGGEEATLPPVTEGSEARPFGLEVDQRFTSPPARYTEASLIKTLESEGIGRPSTYASIIQVIQDRQYAEQRDRRFHATDLGEVVTDKLVEAFPRIMDVGYTREMEAELDKIEEDHVNWVDMLTRFYGPFRASLESALATLRHAKAEVTPAPKEIRCAECGSDMVYRFGRNGRFLSCSRYPECAYAAPVGRDGKPRTVEHVDVDCVKCGSPMLKRTGRFGVFLGCSRYNEKVDACDGILNLDKKGHVVAPSMPPLLTELPCPKCEAPMNLRPGRFGPWLGCSRFPKCRGRGKFNEVPQDQREALEKALAAHEASHPIPIVRTRSGRPLTDAKGKPLPDAPTIDELTGGGSAARIGAASEDVEAVA